MQDGARESLNVAEGRRRLFRQWVARPGGRVRDLLWQDANSHWNRDGRPNGGALDSRRDHGCWGRHYSHASPRTLRVHQY